MRGKGSVFSGSSASLEVTYTAKPVSGWGGLVAVVEYMDRLGFASFWCRERCWIWMAWCLSATAISSPADSENRLKELKEDFGAGGFCLNSFDGAEAAFRLICFLFNLRADFKREGTRDESPRLMTLRVQVLAAGALRKIATRSVKRSRICGCVKH